MLQKRSIVDVPLGFKCASDTKASVPSLSLFLGLFFFSGWFNATVLIKLVVIKEYIPEIILSYELLLYEYL